MSETSAQHDISGIRFPPPLYYLIGLAVGVGIHWMYPIQLGKPGHHLIIYTLGIGWILLGVLLASWAFLVFRRAGTSPNPTRPTAALAVRGPYTLTRNPMYLAMGMVCIGISLLVNMLWPLLLVPAVLVIVDRVVIRKEERYLETKFGDDYRQYKSRVRRWV